MGIRSLIGLLYEDVTNTTKPINRVKYIYCNFDGYPSGVGKELKNNYSSEEKLDRLLNLGSCSSIFPEIVTYFERGDDWESVKPKVVTLQEYREIGLIDYVYLFDPIQNIWQCWNWNKTKIW